MIVNEPLELAYLREQEQRTTDADARADVEQAEIDAGMAAHTILDILQRYGLEFVERVIQEWKQPQPVTCDQCLHWSNAYQLCSLRAAEELPLLPKTHAQTCHFFRDIGF